MSEKIKSPERIFDTGEANDQAALGRLGAVAMRSTHENPDKNLPPADESVGATVDDPSASETGTIADQKQNAAANTPSETPDDGRDKTDETTTQRANIRERLIAAMTPAGQKPESLGEHTRSMANTLAGKLADLGLSENEITQVCETLSVEKLPEYIKLASMSRMVRPTNEAGPDQGANSAQPGQTANALEEDETDAASVEGPETQVAEQEEEVGVTNAGFEPADDERQGIDDEEEREVDDEERGTDGEFMESYDEAGESEDGSDWDNEKILLYEEMLDDGEGELSDGVDEVADENESGDDIYDENLGENGEDGTEGQAEDEQWLIEDSEDELDDDSEEEPLGDDGIIEEESPEETDVGPEENEQTKEETVRDAAAKSQTETEKAREEREQEEAKRAREEERAQSEANKTPDKTEEEHTNTKKPQDTPDEANNLVDKKKRSGGRPGQKEVKREPEGDTKNDLSEEEGVKEDTDREKQSAAKKDKTPDVVEHDIRYEKPESVKKIESFDAKNLSPENKTFMFQTLQEYFQEAFPGKAELIEQLPNRISIVDADEYKRILSESDGDITDNSALYGFYSPKHNRIFVNQTAHKTSGALFKTIFNESMHFVNQSGEAGKTGEMTRQSESDEDEEARRVLGYDTDGQGEGEPEQGDDENEDGIDEEERLFTKLMDKMGLDPK